MKRFHFTCACLVGGLLFTGAAHRANADEWNKKTYVTISQSIEVPGAILQPGKYVFKLVDSAQDRHIVQIMNERENHVFATNLAIPKQRMQATDKTVITFYEIPGGGPEPIRSWFYPGDTIGQEFLYPRERAHQIAMATKQNVPMLAQSRQQTTEQTTTTTASNEAPPPPPAAVVTPEPAPEPTPTPAAEQPAPNPPVEQQAATSESSADRSAQPDTPPPNPAPEPAMPKTAGDGPTLALIGLTCLGAAYSIRRASRVGNHS